MQQRQCFTQGENVELLAQYGLFLAKIATVVVAIAVIAAIIVNLAQRYPNHFIDAACAAA